MSQVTPRTGRPRRNRKAGNSQEAALLASPRTEPMISGVTDGETFHLMIEPRRESRPAAGAAHQPRGLFDDPEPAALPSEPTVAQRADLEALGLPYRFALACGCEKGGD